MDSYKIFASGKGGGLLVTIPKALADALHVGPGTRARWELRGKDRLELQVLRPAKPNGGEP